MRDASELISIKQLFDACEPLSQAERETALAECALDKPLIDEVRRLLTISDNENPEQQHTNIIGQQLQGLTQNLSQDQRLGIYRVEREIGRGGMGIVFLAHRDDGSYQQQVAVKIAPSFASEAELKHFHRERQVLAQLQHPNIAMLLDGGATPEQRPYLVMEYIQGAAITDYCDQQQLGLQRRLTLFLAVCDAVSFAHNHLVIHRDIKPENVLVTPAGQVKLLDFGVSKILHSEQKSHHTTRLSGLTPAYASPEQLAGKATSTATDVYGLGTLLYELLSGSSPHPGGDRSTEQLIRAICEDEPAPVSKAAARSGFRTKANALKGDIDNIVAKSLRKEPQNRYASVSELQRDIERYLTGEPVQATAAGFLYRSGKLVRRYPVASLLTLTVLLTITGGLAATAYLANKLALERDNLLTAKAETERQAHTAQRVTQMLTDMFDAASPARAQGHTVNVEQLLNSAVQKTRTSLNEDPAVKSQLIETLALVKFNTGKYRDAVELQKEALALIPDPAFTEAAPEQRQKIAYTQAESLIRLGHFLSILGEFENAASALSHASRVLHQFPNQHLAALALYREGELESKAGNPDRAIHLLTEAQNTWERLPDKGGKLGIGTRHSLSGVYFNKAEFKQAARLAETVLSDRIALLGESHPETLNSYRQLARCYMRTGRSNEALEQLEHAYEVGKQIFTPGNELFRNIASQYARLVRRFGHHQFAIELLSELIQGEAQSPESTAQLLNHRGFTYFEMGLYAESREDLEKANAIFEKIYPDDSEATYLPRANLGEAMAATGDLEEGIRMINVVIEENIAQFGENDYGVAAWNLKLARIALQEKELEKARRLTDKSRTIYLNTFPRHAPIVLETDQADVNISIAQGDLQRAISQCKTLIESLRKTFPEDAPVIAKYQTLLTELREQNKNSSPGSVVNAAVLQTST
ncbi:serine/threonine-protein kinase [uncultured Microbulbifer sp.]|uniref:serine/threonine-protein kinase n=1 Tax=uncultured Microbulbifer sp. TaxID=348147 RepID=UPI002618F831|nr:serine/threonine-protein kinase [uncultured Microbulbifer sp.]